MHHSGVHLSNLKAWLDVLTWVQATRGGRVKLATIAAPENEFNHPEKGDALHAMEISLALEKLNFQYLYNLHKVDVVARMLCSSF